MNHEGCGLNFVSIFVSAQALGLPLLPPSMPQAGTGQFPTGANFAVFGSLALSPDYYKTKYNFTMPMPWCLDGQLDSFKKVLARIAPGEGTRKAMLDPPHFIVKPLVVIIFSKLV
jgi:hypothetical protein